MAAEVNVQAGEPAKGVREAKASRGPAGERQGTLTSRSGVRTARSGLESEVVRTVYGAQRERPGQLQGRVRDEPPGLPASGPPGTSGRASVLRGGRT